jgi:hypothetical protein
MSRDAHYRKGSVQPIEVIESYKLSFTLGNVVKYVCRHGEKNGREDLLKALWYLLYHLTDSITVADNIVTAMDNIGRVSDPVTADPQVRREMDMDAVIQEQEMNMR